MEELEIGVVARRVGIRPSAIRYYEDVGLLPAPRRVNGRRRYDAGVAARLAVIRLAQAAGFTVGEIRELFSGFPPGTPASERWRALARAKLAEVEAIIAHAQGMKRVLEEALLQCRCLTLEECAGFTVADGEAPADHGHQDHGRMARRPPAHLGRAFTDSRTPSIAGIATRDKIDL
jgi:MerR family redox-sensitive transcriptional activator SoxR